MPTPFDKYLVGESVILRMRRYQGDMHIYILDVCNMQAITIALIQPSNQKQRKTAHNPLTVF